MTDLRGLRRHIRRTERILIAAAVVCALLALVLGFCARPAAAQDDIFCGAHAIARENTTGAMGRAFLGGGTDYRGGDVELYVNPDTGEWTFFAVDPDGRMSCIVAGGSGWHFGEPEPAPPSGDPL